MRVFGKQFSNWWLLLILPSLIICAPFLLILFFAANNFAGAIIGPPAIWNRTWNSPPRADLIGKYVESERHWDQPGPYSRVALELRADGSMSVSALPNDSITSTCILSGTGTWRGPDADQKLDLVYTSDGAVGSCKSDSYPFLELAGHSKPYELYWVLGDPDSGTGIWLRKR
jgi:hypothetical protein